jgi:DNA-binding response OmpR family regulator
VTEKEQSELLRFVVEGPVSLSKSVLASLQQSGILKDKGKPRFFGERFAAFVRRRRWAEVDLPEGIWIDVDAGEVWVDGRPVPTLTELEYRLLQTLYGRLGKLCDKYLIVESVWGQEYIDRVDDARIEKLISRLRSKIEPEPTRPRYLVTIRGRGYRLLHHSAQEH